MTETTDGPRPRPPPRDRGGACPVQADRVCRSAPSRPPRLRGRAASTIWATRPRRHQGRRGVCATSRAGWCAGAPSPGRRLRAPQAARISRTRGATTRPYSSMVRMSRACGSGPALYFKSKRARATDRARRRWRRSSRHRLGRADIERAVFDLALEGGALQRRPAAFGPGSGGRASARSRRRTRRGRPRRSRRRSPANGRRAAAPRAHLGQRAGIEIDIGAEAAAGAPPMIGEHHGQADSAPRAHRFRVPPKPDPGGEAGPFRGRVDARHGERRGAPSPASARGPPSGAPRRRSSFSWNSRS